MVYHDGFTFKGTWLQDDRRGPGTLTFPINRPEAHSNGSTYSGHWATESSMKGKPPGIYNPEAVNSTEDLVVKETWKNTLTVLNKGSREQPIIAKPISDRTGTKLGAAETYLFNVNKK